MMRQQGTGIAGRRPPGSSRTVAVAKAMVAQNALRRTLFDGSFREPAWNMLLCLYVALHERAELTMRTLCEASGEAAPAVDRWVAEMVEEQLVIRESGDGQAGEAAVRIAEEAAAGLECLLQDLAAGVHLRMPDSKPRMALMEEKHSPKRS